MGLKAAQKVRQVRHNSSANFELINVGRTFELKPEPATPWYKAVMYLECSPFLEKERDGGGPIAPMCPFVAFFILPLLAGKCPFVTMHCTTNHLYYW